jgi:hypothetical protein
VFVHHEGAGEPTDEVDRFGSEGYTIGIGVTRFAFFRSPSEDFATKGHNHFSLGICLSGNRMNHDVTDSDLSLIREAMGEARRRGFVVERPKVQPHKDVFPTACPGDFTLARWDEVVQAVNGTEEDDVKIELLVPTATLTEGALKGKRPTIARIVGTPIAFHVAAEQLPAFAGVPTRQISQNDFLDIAVFDVKA